MAMDEKRLRMRRALYAALRKVSGGRPKCPLCGEMHPGERALLDTDIRPLEWFGPFGHRAPGGEPCRGVEWDRLPTLLYWIRKGTPKP